MHDRIKSTGAATDNDVSDDATGVARKAAAKAAAANKKEAATKLAAENDALGDLIAKTDGGLAAKRKVF